MQVGLAGTLVREAVDQPWVGVEVEDDGLVVCEGRDPLAVCQAVGVVGVVDELEEVDDVDEADLEVGEEFAEESGGGEGLVRWDVAARCHDYVGLHALVVAGPVPDAETLGAVLERGVHV